MSLQKIYTRFLTAPSVDQLDPAITFHYITTAVSVNGPDAIVKQLKRESLSQLKKRVEKVLASVETSDSLVLEIETEIEFLTSGANWLPGLDDNFLADHILRFPVVHIVNFSNGRIKEVRLYWDQANLLKQLGVIGRTGRNWPIKDGGEQVKMIYESVSRQASSSSLGGGVPEAPESNSRPKGPESATRDPHASLHLFSPAEEQPEPEKVRAPRRSSAFKPPSRDLESIIGEGDGTEPLQTVKPPKSRGSFSQGQTFDLSKHMDQEDAEPRKPNAQGGNHGKNSNYSHFEFGTAGDQEPEQVQTKRQGKNTMTTSGAWGNEDYATPEKKQPNRDNRSFGFQEEEEDESNAQRGHVLSNVTNGRRANAHHFEIGDNSPAAKKSSRPNQQQQHNQQDDQDDFFSQFGSERTNAGIHIAGNGQGMNKAVANPYSVFDKESGSSNPYQQPKSGPRRNN